MTRNADDVVIRLHRRLLKLYPAQMRERFGAEMQATFRQAWHEARRSGRLGAAGFLVTAAADLLASAAAERRVGTRRGGGSDGLAADLAAGLRAVRRRPGLPLLVAGTLSLGVGANTAVFTLVDAVLLEPLPVADPASLVTVFEARGNDHFGRTSWPTFRELREDLRTLSGLAVSGELDVGLRAGDVSDRVSAGVVSGEWFAVLGLRPQIGRLLQPADEAAGGRRNVVLSDAVWRRHFAADPGVIGDLIELSGTSFTVVGVAPPGFRGTDLSAVHDLWIPVPRIGDVGGDGLFGQEILETRFLPHLRIVGRLRPGVRPPAVEAELNVRHAALREAAGAEMDIPFADPPIHVLPVRKAATAAHRGDILRFLAVPAVVALLTLAVACLNIALLLLVRASDRGREFGIRTALGAGRVRLYRQLLAESLIMGLAGCAAGVAIAQVMIVLLRQFPLPGNVAMGALELGPDARMLGFGLAISLCTAVIFGSAPAWAATRSDPLDQLRGAARNARREGGVGRMTLVAGQAGLCLALLVGAGLFLRSLRAALAVHPGFDAQRVAGASFSAGPHGHTRETAPGFFMELLDVVSATPGVDAAALAVHVPIEPRRLRMPVSNEVTEGGAGRLGGGSAFLPVNIVAGDYFDVFRIPLLEGRAFSPADGPGSPMVAVLSRSAAAELWPGADAIGRQMQLVRGVGSGYTVIGVVEDITAHAVQEGPTPYVYVSAVQNPQIQALSNATLLARDGTDGSLALAAVRSALASLDPTLPVFRPRFVAAQVDAVLVPQRMGTTLLGVFGLVTLLVAAVGVYGVVAWAVSRRSFEIGLRRALGARTLGVVGSVTRPTLLALTLGTVGGLLVAAWSTRFIKAWLFGITPLDPVAWMTAPALLLAAALLAILVPARRAARVSPLIAMRSGE